MRRSIRTKLIITYLALGIITATIAGLLSFFLIIHNARQQEKEYLHAAADSIARQIVASGPQPGLAPHQPEASMGGHQRFGGGKFSRMEFANLFMPAPHSNLSPEAMKQLQNIADTASILHNIRIEILTPGKEVLVTSGGQQSRNFDGTDIDFFFQQFSEMLEENRELKEKISAVGDFDLGEIIILRKGQRLSQFNLNFGAAGDREHTFPQFLSPPPAVKNADPRGQAFIFPIGSAQLPSGYVYISGGPNFTAGAISTARNSLIISSLAAVGIALLLGFTMGQRITSPILALSRASAKMADGDMDARVEIQPRDSKPGRSDEITALAVQFDQMAEKLKTSFAIISKERDALRSFMQDASHHLRTPVTALTTFNELLISSQNPEQAAELLMDSKTQLDRIRWIIDKLLHLSRLDSQVIELNKQDTDIERIIDTAWQSVQSVFQTGLFHLEKEIDPESKIVLCDAQWMEIALTNLFDNAVKYYGDRKYKSNPVTVSVALDQNRLLITVEDRGRGMTPEELAHVFERFFRGSAEDSQGTGLGLAIVKSIVQAHGGVISAESMQGKGSKFMIALPID